MHTCPECGQACTCAGDVEDHDTDMRTCALCGEPMPPGEEMFKYHGYSGPCPAPPLKATPAAEVAYQDLTTLIRKHANELSLLEILAVASNVVGKLIAMQDQRSVTTAQAMAVVQKNIELGNAQVLDDLSKTTGSA